MAYRLALLVLVQLGSVRVAAADGLTSTALAVLGAEETRADVERAVGEAISPAPAVVEAAKLPASGALDDAAASALRRKLGVARLVVVVVRRQSRRFLVTARSVDESGIARRFGEAGESELPFVAARVAGELPALTAAAPAGPKPAAEPEVKLVDVRTRPKTDAATAKATETPPAVELVADAKPGVASEAKPSVAPDAIEERPIHYTHYRRRHPYGLLIGGVVALLAPYFATVGMAAHYEGYNRNAARVGYIPLAGPFLARSAINDKDLHDGYDAGLLADGIVQVLAVNVLVAGIIYCAVGDKVRDQGRDEHASVRPLLSAGPNGAQLGAQVTW